MTPHQLRTVTITNWSLFRNSLKLNSCGQNIFTGLFVASPALNRFPFSRLRQKTSTVIKPEGFACFGKHVYPLLIGTTQLQYQKSTPIMFIRTTEEPAANIRTRTLQTKRKLTLISLLYNSLSPRLNYYHVDFPLSPPLSASTRQTCRQTSMNWHAA